MLQTFERENSNWWVICHWQRKSLLKIKMQSSLYYFYSKVIVISNRISFMWLNFFKIYICYIYIFCCWKQWKLDIQAQILIRKGNLKKLRCFQQFHRHLTLDFSPTSEFFEPELSELACEYQWAQHCPFLQHSFNGIVRIKKDGSSTPLVYLLFINLW